MAEFTLKHVEPKTLKINIDDNSFHIPLQGSLSFKEARTLETPEGTYAFIEKYIPAEVLEPLAIEEYNQIVSAWKKESEKVSRKKLGE